MQTIKCWRLESVGDTGNMLVARFATQAGATDAAARAGGYGPAIVAEEIRIYDSAIEFDPRLNASARESGLAKLTPEEKAALGL